MTTLTVSIVDSAGLTWTLSEERQGSETDTEFRRRVSEMAQKLGLVPAEPKRYLIDVAVRRIHENDDGTTTDVIDFYPPWNKDGTFGKFKASSVYLNTDEDRDRFEAAAGLVVEEMTPMNGPSYTRKFGAKRKDFEYSPVYNVHIVLEPRGEKTLDDGRVITQYRLLGYESDAPDA